VSAHFRVAGGSNFSNLQKHASTNTSSKSKRKTADKTLTSHLFHCNSGIMQHFSSFSIRGTTSALHFIIYFQNLFKKMNKTISSSSNYSGTKMASSNISLAFLSGGTTSVLHFIIYFRILFKKMTKTISSLSNYSG
jgi:hypothetical protein